MGNTDARVFVVAVMVAVVVVMIAGSTSTCSVTGNIIMLTTTHPEDELFPVRDHMYEDHGLEVPTSTGPCIKIVVHGKKCSGELLQYLDSRGHYKGYPKASIDRSRVGSYATMRLAT